MATYRVYASAYVGVWSKGVTDSVIDGGYDYDPQFDIFETNDRDEALRALKAFTTTSDSSTVGEGMMGTIRALYLHYKYPWADGVYLDFDIFSEEYGEITSTVYEQLYLNMGTTNDTEENQPNW